MEEVGDEGALRAAPLPPGWDEAVDLEAPPATIPDPAEVDVPDSLRIEIERLMALYPDRHSATLPALGAAQRVHVRDPSFVNLQALPEMARGHLLADFITCVAMLDPILGGVDR